MNSQKSLKHPAQSDLDVYAGNMQSAITPELVSTAAQAIEEFGEDELERYAEELRRRKQILVTINGVVFTSAPMDKQRATSTAQWFERHMPHHIVTKVDAQEN